MKFNSILLCTLISLSAIAQNTPKTNSSNKPKLVVGIMVDQMQTALETQLLPLMLVQLLIVLLIQ